MAESSEFKWPPPLKVPAIEVVDLLSDTDGELVQEPFLEVTEDKRDASGPESENGENSEWEDSQWSLYEDALLGEGAEDPQYGGQFVFVSVSSLHN